MTKEEIAAEKAATAAAEAEEAAKKAAEDAGKESDESDEEDEDDSEDEDEESESKEEEKEKEEDIDYEKKLAELDRDTPPKRSEREKAAHAVQSIYKRFPDLKEGGEGGEDKEEDRITSLRSDLLRQQVEGVIRQSAKSEAEVKYYLAFYDRKIVKTGNIHEDADNAMWLAGKDRTRNALKEIRRKAPEPGPASGAGQRSVTGKVPELSADRRAQLERNGMHEVAPGHWEGEKTTLKYDKKAKKWDQTIKTVR